MILIIAPFHDFATAVSIQAAKNLQDFYEENQIPFKMLFSLQAFRPFFEGTLIFDKEIDMICYFGHGVKDGLLGLHDFFKMLDTLNSNLIKNKIIYTIACWSAEELGPDCIEKGALTYFGHDNWYYGAFPNKEYDYLADWVDYVTIIPKELVMGKTTSQALESYRNKIDYYVNRYRSWKYLDHDFYENTALSNKENYKLIGNVNLNLSEID